MSIAVLLSLAALTMGLPAAVAKGKPDLAATRVKIPEEAAPGSRMQVTVKIANKGDGKAPASETLVFLSDDRVRGDDVRLNPAIDSPGLRSGRTTESSAKIRVPVGTTRGTYYVVACADGTRKIPESNERNNCSISRTDLMISAPTDHELIDQALVAGEIDDETAVVYKVYSDFGDPRLPTRFQGDDSLAFESDLLSTVAQDLGSYSTENREILEPFLIPPYHRGSWWDIARAGASRARSQSSGPTDYEIRCDTNAPDEFPLLADWGFVDAATGNIRIWWQKDYEATDKAIAESMAAEIDNKIWPELVGLMGRAPMGDDGGDAFKACRGGSDAYDISLVDTSRSITNTLDKCDGTWSRTYFQRSTPAKERNEILAHEIFHAIQNSYDVKNGCVNDEYAWWMEATAQWVEDDLYRSNNREHIFAERMLNEPGTSLDDPGGWDGNDRFYGEYLLPFFLARTNRRDLIRTIWENTTTMGMFAALKAPFGSDWNQLWKDFTFHNWNRGSYNYYEQWDQLTERARSREETIRPGASTFEVPVNYASALYRRFVPEPELTSVKFTNPNVGAEGVGIQAIIEYKDGTWKHQDWSTRDEVEVCLSDPDVESITLVLSNSNTAQSIPPIKFEWEGVEACECPPETSGEEPEPTDPETPETPPACAGEADFEYTFVYSETSVGESIVSDEVRETTTASASIDLVATTAKRSDGALFYKDAGTSDWSFDHTKSDIVEYVDECKDGYEENAAGSGAFPTGSGGYYEEDKLPTRVSGALMKNGTLDLYIAALGPGAGEEVGWVCNDEERATFNRWFLKLHECLKAAPPYIPRRGWEAAKYRLKRVGDESSKVYGLSCGGSYTWTEGSAGDMSTYEVDMTIDVTIRLRKR